MSDQISTIVCAECGRVGISPLATKCPNVECGKDPRHGTCEGCGIAQPKSKMSTDHLCPDCKSEASRQYEEKEKKNQEGICPCCQGQIEKQRRNTKLETHIACLMLGHQQHHDLYANTRLEELVYDKWHVRRWEGSCGQCGQPVFWFQCPLCKEIKFGEPVHVRWRHASTNYVAYNKYKGYYEATEKDAFIRCCPACLTVARKHAEKHQNEAKAEVMHSTNRGCFSVLITAAIWGGGIFWVSTLIWTAIE